MNQTARKWIARIIVPSLILGGFVSIVFGLWKQQDGESGLLKGQMVEAVWNPQTETFDGSFILHNGMLRAVDYTAVPSCGCEKIDLPATLLPLTDKKIDFSLRMNRLSSGQQTTLTLSSSASKKEVYIPVRLARKPAADLISPGSFR